MDSTRLDCASESTCDHRKKPLLGAFNAPPLGKEFELLIMWDALCPHLPHQLELNFPDNIGEEAGRF